MSASNEILETVFKIGAVSKLTNIPVDTLRIWERRYSVVVPIRSKTSDRLYQTKDINRLTLIKILVDHGHSIGTVARLTNDELTERLSLHNKNITRKHNDNTGKSINVTVIGEVLSLQIEYSVIEETNFSYTGVYHNKTDFLENKKDEPIDILVVEYPAIHEDKIKEIESLFNNSGAKKLVLIYGFTNSAAKKLLDKTNYKYIQAPIALHNLQRELLELIEESNINSNKPKNIELEYKAPLRAYNNKQLISLSSASSTIKCECPQHLSSMVIKLVQFEQYSIECIDKYEKDAELHSMLGNMAGHARSILERALSKVVEAENLSVE